MMTGELKNRVDRIWNTFWTGGITNPMTVIEQFTYLLFIRQLDATQDGLDQKTALGLTVADDEHIFTPHQQHLRWKNLTTLTDPTEAQHLMATEVFPFLRRLGGDDSGMAQHMRNATFGIDSPTTLNSAMAAINELDFKNKDLLGDLYEYMLSKLSASGTNGQFRTPQHIINLIVELMRPAPGEKIIDPACGTAGFLVNAAQWVRTHHHEQLLHRDTQRAFQRDGFTGYDFDATMVRIAAMNMFMHGFTRPNIAYRDSLGSIPETDRGVFDVVLANPPFAGSVDPTNLDKALLAGEKTKKTELLFLTRFLTLLTVGGRAAVIVPEGVLFGSTKAHKALRKQLVEGQKLDAVIKLPSGVFKPYSGVSTAVLCFTRTDSPGTDEVWFYEVTADGYSLDDKRTPLLAEQLLGPAPIAEGEDAAGSEPVAFDAECHAKNNLPDVVARFRQRATTERERTRTEQSFCVPVSEIAANDYDLSMNRYKEIVVDDAETRDPLEIIAEIEALDEQIAQGLAELKAMLGGAR
ncbi:class I SAM-dependent DNA methyltransferase [Corynebacterium uterequi]|nr:class I SAM-dependent DNA methyltransferase [Corynebacterium uterequi]